MILRCLCLDLGRCSTLPLAWKHSWRRRMAKLLTPSCRETSHPDIPSLSNPKAHPRSSVLSLRLGGMFAEALISALWIHPCLPNHAWVALMLLSACACIIHASFLPGHCCQVETAKVRQTHHEFYTYRRHLCWLLLNCSVCKTESGM